MKKVLNILIVCISVFILNGCVNTDVSLDIDKKGDIKLQAKLLSSEYLISKINENELKNTYKDVEKITESGKTGYKITDNLGNIKNLNIEDSKKLEEYKDLVSIKKKEEFIYNMYDINIHLKDYLNNGMNSEELSIINLIGSGVDVNLHLNTPLELIESNATSSSKDNGINTYNWEFNLSNIDNIHVKTRIPNIKNISMVGISILIIIFTLILMIFIAKKKRK